MLYKILQSSVMILSVIYFILAIGYAFTGNLGKFLYWIGACVLNVGIWRMEG